MLILTRREGQRIIIDHDIVLKVLHIECPNCRACVNGEARLGFDAPDEVPIWREEIWRKMLEDEASDD